MLLSTTIVVTFRPTCKRKTSSIELSSAAVFVFVLFFFSRDVEHAARVYFASSSIPRNHSALHRVEKRAPWELESGSKSNLTSIQAVLCLPNMTAILDLNP